MLGSHVIFLVLAAGLFGGLGCSSSANANAPMSGIGGAPDEAAATGGESALAGASSSVPDLESVVNAREYRQWARAPGYASRQGSQGPHGGSVDIYVNDTVSQALATPGLPAWPDGSLIVKDGFQGEAQRLTAIMLKQGGEWQWAEYYDTGEAFSGSVSVCSNCHHSGSDFVRAFALP